MRIINIIFIVYLLGVSQISFAQVENKIIATVENEVITELDLKTYLAIAKMQLSDRYKGKELEDKIRESSKEALNNLIEDKLILSEAKNKGMQIKKEYIRERIDGFRKNFPSEEVFQGYLNSNGLSISDLERKFREQIMTMEMINLEIRSKVMVSPGEITDFYMKHKDDFRIEEKRDVLAIRVRTKDELNRAMSLLNTKISFQQAQQELDSNINLGLIGRDSLKPEVAKVVFSLEENKFSAPFLQDDGYYIFYVNEIIKDKTQDLREAQTKINEYLLNEKIAQALTNWMDKLRAKAKITIRD